MSLVFNRSTKFQRSGGSGYCQLYDLHVDILIYECNDARTDLMIYRN